MESAFFEIPIYHPPHKCISRYCFRPRNNPYIYFEVLHELCQLIKIGLKQATLEYLQNIGLMERSKASLKRTLKLNTNKQWNDRHKNVSLATFIQNTSYNSLISCCRSAVFHRREPIKPLNLRFLVQSFEKATAQSDYVSALLDAMLEKINETRCKLIASYQRYRKNYEKKQAHNLINFTKTACFSIENSQHSQILLVSHCQFVYHCIKMKNFK